MKGITRFNNMMALALALALLAGCLFASAMSDEDIARYTPGWFGENWEDDNAGGGADILQNFWLSMTPKTESSVDPFASADIYGWYNESWFGLANWEREVCLLDLSSGVRNIRNAVEDSSLENVNVYTTTITITATKDYGINDSYLYEVSWYIMPYGGDVKYRVYLQKGTKKYYVEGKKGDGDNKWTDASRYSGESDYWVNYLNLSYDNIILEYRDETGNGEYSDDVNVMNVSVVPKQDFSGEESSLDDGGEETDG